MSIDKGKDIRERISVKSANIVLVALIALATLVVIYFLLLAAPPAMAQDDSSLIGKVVPDFELYDYARNVHELKSYRGKVVLLTFWWPGDANCEKALKILQNVYQKYPQESLQVVAVDLKAQTSKALMLITRIGVDYLCLEGIYKAHIRDYQLSGVPSIFLVNRDGIVRKIYAGLEDKNKLYADIDQTLREKFVEEIE